MRTIGLGLAIGALAACGCVRRELVIASTPPGATVQLDGEILEQQTPARLPFWWYGTHEIVVEKEGYCREVQIAHVRPPWYEQFPIDVIPDLLLPWTINDIHTFEFQLQKRESVAAKPDAEKEALKAGLLERAGEFRTMARTKVGEPSAEEKAEKPDEPKKPETAEEK
jgi:hypothetical protein